MDKKDLLALMRLLSALESWSFSAGQRLPDYLLEEVSRMTGLLEDDILNQLETAWGLHEQRQHTAGQ